MCVCVFLQVLSKYVIEMNYKRTKISKNPRNVTNNNTINGVSKDPKLHNDCDSIFCYLSIAMYKTAMVEQYP